MNTLDSSLVLCLSMFPNPPTPFLQKNHSSLLIIVLQDYGMVSTTHGIAYIVQDGQTRQHRVVWAAVVALGVG